MENEFPPELPFVEVDRTTPGDSADGADSVLSAIVEVDLVRQVLVPSRAAS